MAARPSWTNSVLPEGRSVKRAFLALGIFVAAIPAAAFAQTTTSSTTTSSSSTSTSSSTTSSTVVTTTTIEPFTGDPSPPAATLASSFGQVEGERGSSCWRVSARSAVCADVFQPRDPAQALDVQQGETLTLRFGTSLPLSELSGVLIREPGRRFELPAENPARFTADFPVGVSVGSFHARFGDAGSASYYFKLGVVARSGPATPTIATQLTLTG